MSDLLATPEELNPWVDDDIPPDDPRALAYLWAASVRVRAYTGCDWPDGEVPDAAKMVTLQVAARVWRNPDAYVQDTTGPFTVRWAERVAEGIFLYDGEKEALDPLRCASRPALWTMGTTRGPIETGSVYVPPSIQPLLERGR